MSIQSFPDSQNADSFEKLILGNDINKVDELTTDAQVLFGLLTLIVDIEFRLEQDNNSDDISKQDM